MSDAFDAMSMIDLFREEVDAHSAVLDTELLALEREPDARPRLDATMRAAHSLKGAAKIVGIDVGVRIAHAMEEILVSAREGSLRIDRAIIDAELACVDLLRRLARETDADVATFGARYASAIDATLVALEAARAAALARPAPAPAEGAASATEDDAKAAPAQADAQQRIVRVGAEGMSRILGLSGESLVASARLDAVVEGFRALHQRHTGLEEVLAEMHDLLHDSPAAIALIDEARLRSIELRQAVSERVDEFETEARANHDLVTRVHREVLGSRMRPISEGIDKLPRIVRDLARSLDKEVTIVVVGGHVGVDRDVLEKLEAPIGHLVRNAIDHGCETIDERISSGKPRAAELRIEARHRGGMLLLRIVDDGRGIDVEAVRKRIVIRRFATEASAASLDAREVIEFLFLPGFSTRDEVTEISGRGVGLDVVQSTIREIGGEVRISSTPGSGTAFELEVPLTRSVVRCLVFESRGLPHAIPLHRVDRVIGAERSAITTIEGREALVVDEKTIGLIVLDELLDLDGQRSGGDSLRVVVIGDRSERFGLVVDRVFGEQELVVRPLDPRLGRVQDVSAVALGRDGHPIVILDADDLVRSCASLAKRGRPRRIVDGGRVEGARKRILVVDDSITVREVERQILENKGYDVTVAVDGAEGWNAVRGSEFALVITDVDMPRMNGLELTRAIKQHPRLSATPVMIVSYKERETDRLRGLEVGADYYLGKAAFHDEALVRAVEDLIGGPS